jgi:hypothetical protein
MNPEEKKRRMMEKALRLPINDVILEIHKGWIDINDLYKMIDLKVKAKAEEKKNG